MHAIWLTNVPATFQQLIENCLGEIYLQWCIIYLENIIIFSKTPKNHTVHLRGVFDKLACSGLKLNPANVNCLKLRLPTWITLSPKMGSRQIQNDSCYNQLASAHYGHRHMKLPQDYKTL